MLTFNPSTQGAKEGGSPPVPGLHGLYSEFQPSLQLDSVQNKTKRQLAHSEWWELMDVKMHYAKKKSQKVTNVNINHWLCQSFLNSLSYALEWPNH